MSLFPYALIDAGQLARLRRDVQRLSSELATVRRQRDENRRLCDEMRGDVKIAKAALSNICHNAPTPVMGQLARDALMDLARSDL